MPQASSESLKNFPAHRPFTQTFYHGTKAQLQLGELTQVGFASNFGLDLRLGHVYQSATLDAAVWGAELPNSQPAMDGSESTWSSRPARWRTTRT